MLIQNLRIHVLALCEAKLGPSFPRELTAIIGYEQERLDRTCHGRGVSIYIRNSINCKRRTDLPRDDLELICIEVVPSHNKPFLLLAWCRPPSDTVETFHKLDKVLAFLDSEHEEIILLGDTNYDLTNKPGDLNEDINTRHLCNLYELCNFHQLIINPTLVTLTTSSIIDHIATTCARNISDSGVHKISMSDHHMVFCVCKFDGGLLKDRKIIKTRSMKRFDAHAFLSDVCDIWWEGAPGETDDVNVLVKKWSTLFSLTIDNHAPLRSLQASEKHCPWISKDLRCLMRSRDRLKKGAVRGNSQLLFSSYRHAGNKVNKLNNELKRQHFLEKLLCTREI